MATSRNVNRSKPMSGRFGAWTVISSAGSATELGKRAAKWLCRCDCGVEKVVIGASLRKDASHGCGSCSKRGKPYSVSYNKLRKQAEYSNIECTLTYEQYVEFTLSPDCHYCGDSLTWIKHMPMGKYSLRYNLDRKDNDKGYSADNCVPCCQRCNYSKNCWLSYEEMVAVGNIRRTKNVDLQK